MFDDVLHYAFTRLNIRTHGRKKQFSDIDKGLISISKLTRKVYLVKILNDFDGNIIVLKVYSDVICESRRLNSPAIRLFVCIITRSGKQQRNDLTYWSFGGWWVNSLWERVSISESVSISRWHHTLSYTFLMIRTNIWLSHLHLCTPINTLHYIMYATSERLESINHIQP